VRRWEQDSDPVLLYARELMASGALTREALLDLDRQVREEAQRAADFALNSPMPKSEAALEHAFA
jgi:TPP-dependent pyruvate/acetoin dehydrogenase alpha subunit